MQELLKKLLEEKGATQYFMAKSIGVAKSTVNDWLKGRSEPKATRIKRLAEFFGVGIDIFIDAIEKDEERNA